MEPKNNSVNITGRLAKDPVVQRNVETGNITVVFVTLAVYNGFDKEANRPRDPHFIDASFFPDVAVQAASFKKGEKVNVLGSLVKINKPLIMRGEQVLTKDQKPVHIDHLVVHGYKIREVINTKKPLREEPGQKNQTTKSVLEPQEKGTL